MEVITEDNRYMIDYTGGSKPGWRPVEIYKKHGDHYFGKDLNTDTETRFSKAKIVNLKLLPDDPFKVPS